MLDLLRAIARALGFWRTPPSPLDGDDDDHGDGDDKDDARGPTTDRHGWHSWQAASVGDTYMYRTPDGRSIVAVTFVDTTPRSTEAAARAHNPYAGGPFAASARFVGALGDYVRTIECTSV
jgi:hypothetical protein